MRSGVRTILGQDFSMGTAVKTKDLVPYSVGEVRVDVVGVSGLFSLSHQCPLLPARLLGLLKGLDTHTVTHTNFSRPYFPLKPQPKTD